jgi:hypothetical protein
MPSLKNKLLLTTFFIAIIVGTLVFDSLTFSSAQTFNEVNGVISGNVTLTKANGPYQFDQVVVNAGATLTIEAGSSINGGSLVVSGTLIAKGTSNNQIYFNTGSMTFTSSSSSNSIIDHAILTWLPVSISSSVTITNSYLKGSQATSTITINAGSPTISYNTIKGTLDASRVISIFGGSPTISNNNIIAFVDNGLYPNPPAGMNRFGSENGVYAANVNGAQITDNKFYQPFRSSSVQVISGTATVQANTEYPNDSVPFPSPTPPIPTPTPVPTPTLPPYPPASTPTSTQTTTQSPTQTTNTPTNNANTPNNEGNLYEIVIAVIIASVVINAVLVVAVAVLLKKRQKVP